MKCYILVDVPVDDPVEIDEYGMYATLQVTPFVPSTKKELYFDVVKEIRPMPSRKYNHDSEMDIGYTLGWNNCLEELEE